MTRRSAKTQRICITAEDAEERRKLRKAEFLAGSANLRVLCGLFPRSRVALLEKWAGDIIGGGFLRDFERIYFPAAVAVERDFRL
jgi:hypothetical protein